MWCADARLWNSAQPNIDGILSALEEAELEALSAVDALEEAATPGGVRQASSYADSGIVAELAWNNDEGKADFIVLERSTGHISRSDRVDTHSGTIVVPRMCDGIVTPGGSVRGAVYLATEVSLGGEDEMKLRESLAGFVNKYVELPGDAVHLAIEYILLSWVFDRFDELPFLAFRTADAGRGKSRALETVGALCRMSMFVGGGSSAAATLRLLDAFGGTMVADEFDFKRDTELAATLTQNLNQGFQSSRPLIKCDGERNEPRPFGCYGPKIFALRRTFPDDATESRTISIFMVQRTRKDIPINLPRSRFDAEALGLRNRLLGWRLTNLDHIRIDPSLAASGLEDRLNQIGLPLLSIAQDDKVRTAIVRALREQQASVAADRADSLMGSVFEAVLATVESDGTVRPGVVAAEANRRTAKTEGIELEKPRKPLKSHKVGWVLKRDLELHRDRDRAGTFYRLTANRARLLAIRFGAPLTGLPQLPHCHTATTLPHESGLLGSASGDCDNGGNCGNVGDAGGNVADSVDSDGDFDGKSGPDGSDTELEFPPTSGGDDDLGDSAAAWARR